MLELGGNKLGEEGWSSGEKGNGRGRRRNLKKQGERGSEYGRMVCSQWARQNLPSGQEKIAMIIRRDATRCAREMRERRGGRGGEEGRKEGRGKKYSIKRNGGLANIYLWVGREPREKRKEPCENVPSRMALVAAQKRGKFS